MSQELPQKDNNTELSQKGTSKSEEIDLLVLFNMIGNAFSKLFDFLTSILKVIFSKIIYVFRVFIDNWKLIIGIMFISAVIGFLLERTKSPMYSSGMLVQPYFDSKYQLVTNINYFNELISNQDYSALKEIFEINEELVKTLKGFKIEPGPENENDRILYYEEFISKIDSVRAQDISYEDYIGNRSIYSGNVFLITAESYKKDIFKSLEGGIASAFSNEFSKSERRKRDSLIAIQKQNILDQISVIDSLKGIYIDVLKTQAKTNSAKQVKLGDISLGGQENSSITKEYELLNKEIQLRNVLQKLDEQKIEENTYFDVISSFQKVGSRVVKLSERYSLIFPVLSFGLICVIYFSKSTITFIRKYEF